MGASRWCRLKGPGECKGHARVRRPLTLTNHPWGSGPVGQVDKEVVRGEEREIGSEKERKEGLEGAEVAAEEEDKGRCQFVV